MQTLSPADIKVPTHVAYRIAALAGCDPRTIRHLINGRPGLGVVRERVEKAMRELGLGHMIPAAPVAAATKAE